MTSRPTNPIAEIVDRLTKASKRALPKLSADWASGEGTGVAGGIYSLGWGKNAGERLIERRWTQGGSLEVRLTARGLEVQKALREAASLARKGVGDA